MLKALLVFGFVIKDKFMKPSSSFCELQDISPHEQKQILEESSTK
jgi:hypothetical protein